MSPRRHFWLWRQLQGTAEQWLMNLRSWQDFGRSVPAWLLVKLLTFAASIGVSLTRAAKMAQAAPSYESVRNALLANLPGLPVLTSEICQGLQAIVPRRVLKHPVTVAVDYHKRPYYGDRDRTPEVCGGKAQASTHWFWTYATLSIIDRGQRWTVAVIQVPREERHKVSTLVRLWQEMAHFPLKIKRVLLDRDFYSADVISWLQKHRLPFLMPMLRRGNPKTNSGTRRFFKPGMQGSFEYEWRGDCQDRPLVRVQVACVPDPDHPRGSPLVYVFGNTRFPCLTWIKNIYRRRFVIETSYRQLGEALAQTTTRNPQWRLMLVGISLLLRNLWVSCQQAASVPDAVPFKLILAWISHSYSKSLHLIAGFAAKPRHPDFATKPVPL